MLDSAPLENRVIYNINHNWLVLYICEDDIDWLRA